MAKSLMMLWFFFSILSLQCSNMNAQQVSGLYVFGDSTVDAGNNNNLQTKAKANFLPYGIDFHNTPTGRFTNGLTSADLIAKFLGLPLPPAYMNLAEAERSKITTGLNFASASCGILPDTGSSAGYCLSFDKQIDLFENSIKSANLGVHLDKSIAYISIGSNDYILNYLGKPSVSPAGFAQSLTDELFKRLQRLYGLGVRKFLVSGIGSIGCIPLIRETIKHTGNCVALFNQDVQLYNAQLFSKLPGLQLQLPSSFFTYLDEYKVFQDIIDHPVVYGITNFSNGCWDPNSKAGVCQTRDKYLFFDNVHATEHANSVLVNLCFTDKSICSPMTIKQLASA